MKNLQNFKNDIMKLVGQRIEYICMSSAQIDVQISDGWCITSLDPIGFIESNLRNASDIINALCEHLVLSFRIDANNLIIRLENDVEISFECREWPYESYTINGPNVSFAV